MKPKPEPAGDLVDLIEAGVIQRDQDPAPRKCSSCGALDHTRRTCGRKAKR